MGSSINYMGKYFTQINKMKDDEIINVISSRYKRILKGSHEETQYPTNLSS